MRSLQICLHRSWDRLDPSALVPWSPDCLRDLWWWLRGDHLSRGVSLHQVYQDLDFWSNASDVGGGAHLGDRVVGMLAKGALEIARDPGPGFYSRLFLVEKVSGIWRPVIDLSHLNEFVQLTPFKMETVSSVLLSVREGDFLASLDLKDAYFQILIHRSSRKLLRFTSEGTVYQFQALCFGLLTAPQVFTRVFSVVSAWAHSHGIRPPLSGRLVGSLLLGAGSQTDRPVAPLALSHLRDCDKREEVGSRALADCEVPRHDH